VATPGFRYVAGERRPVEVLVFEVEPDHLDDFLQIDHEVWTLGEALLPGLERIPFLSKEVWLDDSRPGRVTLVFVWESMELWERVGAAEVQRRLQTEFDERFAHPVRLVASLHEDADFGIHRWSRFERD
jgi:uncharacterized protein (TIGR03792 family)